MGWSEGTLEADPAQGWSTAEQVQTGPVLSLRPISALGLEQQPMLKGLPSDRRQKQRVVSIATITYLCFPKSLRGDIAPENE